jgi:hypothetical protein
VAVEAPRERVHGEVLNVGDDDPNYRVREVAVLVAAAFPGCRLAFGPSNGDRRSYRVSFARIREVLPGFACAHDAARGAHELRAWFERVGLTRERFEFRAFTRIRQLEHLLATGQLDGRLAWRIPRLAVA